MYNLKNRCSGECVKPLVIYYSLISKTKLVAQVIAEALNATLVEIKETKPRKLGPSVYSIGGLAATMNRSYGESDEEITARAKEAIKITKESHHLCWLN
jgi:hypothetical protein